MDPLLHIAWSGFVGGLLLISGAHKLLQPAQFRRALQGFQFSPLAVAAARWSIPTVELASGGTAVFLRGSIQQFGLLVCAGLLCGYAALLRRYIERGYLHINCGCLGSGSSVSGLSLLMVYRNGLLASLAIAALLPESARPLTWLDVSGAAAAVAVMGGIYMAGELSIRLAMRSLS